MLSYHLAATFPASQKTASKVTSTGHSRVLHLKDAYFVVHDFCCRGSNDKLLLKLRMLFNGANLWGGKMCNQINKDFKTVSKLFIHSGRH